MHMHQWEIKFLRFFIIIVTVFIILLSLFNWHPCMIRIVSFIFVLLSITYMISCGFNEHKKIHGAGWGNFSNLRNMAGNFMTNMGVQYPQLQQQYQQYQQSPQGFAQGLVNNASGVMNYGMNYGMNTVQQATPGVMNAAHTALGQTFRGY